MKCHTSLPFNLDIRFQINDLQEAESIRRILIVNCNNIERLKITPKPHPDKQYYYKRMQRIEMIHRNLPIIDVITSGGLWRKLRKKHSMSYKTFQRDIATLIIQGRVYYQKSTGGKDGKTTFLSKK